MNCQMLLLAVTGSIRELENQAVGVGGNDDRGFYDVLRVSSTRTSSPALTT